MADEKVIGGGVGGLNTGDTGINDGSSGTGGGGGGSSTQTSTSTSGASGTSGTSTSSGTSKNNFSQKEAEIDTILDTWMSFSAIGLTFDQVVKLYVENKLGFGANGKTLKKKYKKDNPDMDPAEIDEEVDEQLKATTEEFTTPGRAGKEELQAKYNEFKASSFEVLGNLEKMGGELAKTIANAYMPTSIGPVAPNPLSVALKLYMGLTALKKLLDRIVISMTVLMAAARSIGADKSPPYKAFINEVHKLLGGLVKDIKNEEKAVDEKTVKKAQYLSEYKKNYFVTAPNGTDTIGYKIIEEIARNDFNIYIWPLETSDINKLYNIINVNPVVSMIPGIGVIAAIIDVSTNDTKKERKAKMLLEYNNKLVEALKQFEEDHKIQLEAEKDNGSSGTNSGNDNDGSGSSDTDIPSYDELSSSGTSGSSGSSGSSGGGNNTTGNFIQKFTRALFKRING